VTIGSEWKVYSGALYQEWVKIMNANRHCQQYCSYTVTSRTTGGRKAGHLDIFVMIPIMLCYQ